MYRYPVSFHNLGILEADSRRTGVYVHEEHCIRCSWHKCDSKWNRPLPYSYSISRLAVGFAAKTNCLLWLEYGHPTLGSVIKESATMHSFQRDRCAHFLLTFFVIAFEQFRIDDFGASESASFDSETKHVLELYGIYN